MSHAATLRVAQDAPTPTPAQPVAGSINPEKTPIQLAVDDWLENMQRRRKKPKSIAAFRQVVTLAMRECEWQTPADITFKSIDTWMTETAKAKGWKGATYNRNLCVFRSFTRRLHKCGLLPHDIMADAVRAEEDDSGDGARAATLEEAKALLMRAWVRELNDKRCRGNRRLYFACNFALGLRLDEPARWRRKHVQVFCDQPFIDWKPDINKGRKRRIQPVPMWLAQDLREHMKSLPDDPEALVFPVVPNKATFEADRKAAGITKEDSRGRTFSSHSARKFFRTYLRHVAKINEEVVNYLMRHTVSVAERYDDCPQAIIDAANAIPDLLPAERHYTNVENRASDYAARGLRADLQKSVASGLDNDTATAQYVAGATRSRKPDQTESTACPPDDDFSRCTPSTRGSRDGHVLDSDACEQPDKLSSKRSAVRSSRDMRPEMPSIDLIIGEDRTGLADRLEELAKLVRLLRKEAADGQFEQRGWDSRTGQHGRAGQHGVHATTVPTGQDHSREVRRLHRHQATAPA